MERKKIIIIIGVVLVILILILVFGLKEGRRGISSASLEFWSVYDNENIYRNLIGEYQKANKGIIIKYIEKSPDTYEEELVNALAAGKEPDIFAVHNTWLPKHQDKINPMPQIEEFFTLKGFQDTFPEVVYQDFVAKESIEPQTGDRRGEEVETKEQIYALPLYMDTLALYYNKDFFNSAGIPSPPITWDELLDDVEKLTKRDKWGNIERAGITMGTAKNINRSTDILALLMLQTGTEMVEERRTKATFNQATYLAGAPFNPGQNALGFYVDFSNPTKRVYCWNRQMPYSIDAFYQGKTAMMINYSHHIDTIKSKSPYLNFGVAPVPQIKDRSFDINYANYWGLTVSKNSKHSQEAWRFIRYLAQKENVKKYLQASKRPTARRDLIEWQKNNTNLGAFAVQILSARSWYQIDSQAIEKIFADMVESIVLGAATIEQAINKAADQITILMK